MSHTPNFARDRNTVQVKKQQTVGRFIINK